MDEIYNIRKLENLKEYLILKRVSPRILLNPRGFEILDQIAEDFNIIHLDDEVKAILEEKLQILEDGSLSYTKENKRVKICKEEKGVSVTTEQHIKGKESVYTERRCLDEDGLEYMYEISTAKLSEEEFKAGKKITPTRKIIYKRDLDAMAFIEKVEENEGLTFKTYLEQKNPYMLQNLRIDRRELKRMGIEGNNIEAICISLEKTRVAYNILKKIFFEKKKQEELWKGYQILNKKYATTRKYEKSIAKNIGVSQERS